jgi:HK97 family phage major capsid protein/HK97 family phage prohead protease
MMPYKPTNGMIEEADRGLAWRREFGRGGTEVGIARARDISNGRNLSEDTVKRMFSFFSRHEVDKKAEGFRVGEKGYPSNGRIAWALWGGDAGFSWCRKIAERLQEEDRTMQDIKKSDTVPQNAEEEIMNNEVRAEADELSVGDFVSWNSSGGEAYGKIERIERDGSIDVPDTDFTINGDPEDPAALIEVYREGEEGYEGSGIMAGHRFSTLTKTDERGYKKKDKRLSRENMETRGMSFDGKVVDEDKRTVRIAVSSEEPVERSFGNEILDHSERSIDLSFAKSGRMPLLLDHDPRQQIGVVEDVSLDGSARRLRATVRFGRNGLAKEVFDDVVDGIRSNISVGYHVNDMERQDADSYRVKSWLPMEVSVVSIPADRTVGVGRAAEKPPAQPITETLIREETIMSEDNKIDIDAVKAEATRAAAKDTAEMYRLAAKHNKRDLADKAVSEGRSLAEFRGELLDVIGNAPLDTPNEIGLAPKEARQFSLLRAIRAHANPTDRSAQKAAAFELEAAAAASDAMGVEAQGIMIPADVLRSWKVRDMNTTDDAGIIADDFRGGDFIDVLRNASSVMQAGATMLTGLSGNVKIPKKTAASSAGWISSEGGASAESEPTVGQVTMSPKVLGAHTDITRVMMQQSSLDVEALVRNDLTASIALAIDLGALAGTGSSGQPTGVKNTSGINTPTDFAAANPTFAEVVAMETAVAEDNALQGNLAYILPASMYGALKTTAKDAGSGQFVVAPDGSMNGYNAIVSNQVTAGDLYFGNFADLLIGMYGGLDIVVDPYTASSSGTVRIVALQTVDVAVRHAVSFAFNNDGA